MPELGSQSVHLVITSPPYYNLKKYGSYDQVKSYSEYLYNLQPTFKEIKRVMMPGRFVAIIIGTAISDQGIKPINADIIRIMESLKFTFVKEIIWMKPKGTQGLWQRGVTRFLKREPYPCLFSVNIQHEYILIFRNEGQMQLRFKPEHRLSEKFIKEVSWSVWEIGVSYTKGHPAPFPDEIPERLIRLYTIKGETVLDPFGGSGTTMKAAKGLKRNSILYEVNANYEELIKQNVKWEEINDLDTKYKFQIRRTCPDPN
jgi:site-specific DNA-methyltransferase (adenine-specific)